MPDPTASPVGGRAPATAPLSDLAPPRVKLRASDADRQATVEVVQDAIGRGLLTPAEGSERMGVAFAAVHLEDLEPITADLPAAPVPVNSAIQRLRLFIVLERLESSIRTALIRRGRRAQLAAALVLFFLLITCGLMAPYLLFGHGGGPGHGGFRHP